MRELLDIPWNRPVCEGGYGMIAQLRSWLPDPIGGVYWFYLDNQYVSAYVPIYAGVQRISSLYQNWDPDRYSEHSTRWAIDFVDNLLYLRWQDAVKDLWEIRAPLEAEFFSSQSAIESEALSLYRKDPGLAHRFLTDLTVSRMETTVKVYQDLRNRLIAKYTNNNYLRQLVARFFLSRALSPEMNSFLI